MLSVRAILIDMSGVLTERVSELVQAYRTKPINPTDQPELAAWAGGEKELHRRAQMCLEAVDRAMQETDLELTQPRDAGEIFLDTLAEEKAEIPETLRDAWIDTLASYELGSPIEGAAKALGALRETGIPLGLVSNVRMPGRYHRAHLETLEIADPFKVMIFSTDVGYRMPRKEIFERALAELELEPGDVLHVGDETFADVKGARISGLRSVLVTGGYRHTGEGEMPPDHVIQTLAELPSLLEGSRS